MSISLVKSVVQIFYILTDYQRTVLSVVKGIVLTFLTVVVDMAISIWSFSFVYFKSLLLGAYHLGLLYPLNEWPTSLL